MTYIVPNPTADLWDAKRQIHGALAYDKERKKKGGLGISQKYCWWAFFRTDPPTISGDVFQISV